MAMGIYRNSGLIQVQLYRTTTDKTEKIIDLIRQKWSFLREKNYAGDYPVEILFSVDETPQIIEVFRWSSQEAQCLANVDAELKALNQHIQRVADSHEAQLFTQVQRGFSKDFPKLGGVELLRGVCSCLLTINGVVENYLMSVKNGIVLMHRSPRLDLDGDGLNEMYLKILMHGGDIIQDNLGPVRVEQNFSLPNDGLIKSKGQDNHDFPGYAVWRVAWRIHTAFGSVLTDPATPLIFGPTEVKHYPPVGTRFKSQSGPVKLLQEATGEQIGILIPSELTAFDIVVTKDDEIDAYILNAAPIDIFDILQDTIAKHPIQAFHDD